MAKVDGRKVVKRKINEIIEAATPPEQNATKDELKARILECVVADIPKFRATLEMKTAASTVSVRQQKDTMEFARSALGMPDPESFTKQKDRILACVLENIRETIEKAFDM